MVEEPEVNWCGDCGEELEPDEFGGWICHRCEDSSVAEGRWGGVCPDCGAGEDDTWEDDDGVWHCPECEGDYDYDYED